MTPRPPADVNVAAALKRLGNNMGFYRQVYEAVRKDAGKMLDRVAEISGEGPSEESERIFHTLKGLAGTIGATGFAQAAADAEEAARSPGGAGAGHVAAMRAAYASACEAIDRELTRLG